MPPIMGATAFVIADALGVPYLRIVTAAMFPAILYYIGVFATVHFRAAKQGLYEPHPEQLPNFFSVLFKEGYMLLPIGGIVAMLVMEYTPTMAAFWGGIVVAIVLTVFSADTRLNVEKLINIAERSARTAMGLAIAMALVGVLVGVASLTGITMTIADKIFGLSGGWMPAAVILTMVVAIILGMGVPTTPAYVLASISAAPVLMRMGVPDIVAHMFVFYFAVMSALTPPVCTGAYTAAGLAGANPNKVGFTSLRLALGGFIVPLIFINYNSVLLVEGFSIVNLVYIVTAMAIALVLISAAFEGHMLAPLTALWRIGLAVASVLMLLPVVPAGRVRLGLGCRHRVHSLESVPSDRPGTDGRNHLTEGVRHVLEDQSQVPRRRRRHRSVRRWHGQRWRHQFPQDRNRQHGWELLPHGRRDLGSSRPEDRRHDVHADGHRRFRLQHGRPGP